jgi:hypothetical protein
MNALTRLLPQVFSCRVVASMLAVLFCSAMLTGCIATRSDIQGRFTGQADKNAAADKVSVLFLFRHMGQQHGFDSIPKLKGSGVKDFDNLFRDALPEISNISLYNTYVELPGDVNILKRRQELENYKNSHDYTLELTFFEESSFKQDCLSGTVSLLSLTVIPMPYSWDYTITATLKDKKGNSVRTYERKATLDNWVEALLIFAYPFYPVEGKREEIYSASLHNIFRQIEAEKVLKKL